MVTREGLFAVSPMSATAVKSQLSRVLANKLGTTLHTQQENSDELCVEDDRKNERNVGERHKAAIRYKASEY